MRNASGSRNSRVGIQADGVNDSHDNALNSANLTKQIRGVYWLRQHCEMMSLQARLSKQFMRRSLPREEKDLAIGTTRFDLNGEFDARELRHDDIANQEIRRIDFDIRQGLQRVGKKSS